MDPVDLHSWASRHLDDPELGEVARALRRLLVRSMRDDVLLADVRVLVAASPASAEWWRAYDRLLRDASAPLPKDL